jgi:glycosyltransferase involved in cell wall biosynthesis
MDQPKISVLMPAFNSERYIEQALQSILSQTFYDFELIIVNDGSTDRTQDIIKTYSDKRIRLSIVKIVASPKA